MIIKCLMLGLLLVGCTNNNCPKDPYRKYIFGDKVKVISGFFKGQTGIIISRWQMYERGCVIRAFKVQLDYSLKQNDPAIATISQYKLFVERK